MGCDQQDLKYYKRDLKAMIKDSNAHMFVDILKKRKGVDPCFCYAHELDEENRLKNVFRVISYVPMHYLGACYLST